MQEYQSTEGNCKHTPFRKTINIELNLKECRSKFSVTSLRGLIILTKRELDCLYYLLIGFSAKLIARHLNISSRTVEKHIDRIKDKLGCNTRSEILSLISYAIHIDS